MKRLIILCLIFVPLAILMFLTNYRCPKKADNGSQYSPSATGSEESGVTVPSNIPALHFSSLAAWDYNKDKPSNPSDALQKMSGKKVTVIGFMYPLQQGDKIKVFCLLRSTQTCCYGPKPQFNQYLFVEMNQLVKFERLSPVIVTGTFFIDPKPDEGYIYRLEGTDMEIDVPDEPKQKISASDIPAGITLFDFKLLEALEVPLPNVVNDAKDLPDIKLPESLTKLEGKTVTVSSYIVLRGNNPLQFFMGKYWWDGCCTGTPPTLFNAMFVELKKGKETPNTWTESGTFTGTFHVTKDKSQWLDKGLISIEDAISGIPKK